MLNRISFSAALGTAQANRAIPFSPQFCQRNSKLPMRLLACLPLLGWLATLVSAQSGTGSDINFYVSCNISAPNSTRAFTNGTIFSPFNNLFDAQMAVRKLPRPLNGSVYVNIFPSDCYPIDPITGRLNFNNSVLTLTTTDSGTSTNASVTYRAVNSGVVRLLGGYSLKNPAAKWTLTQIPGSSNFSQPAWLLNLSAIGVLSQTGVGQLTTGGTLSACAGSKLMELFINKVPMEMARYPNLLPSGGSNFTFITRNASLVSTYWFFTSDNRADTWVGRSGLFMHGWWKYDWADSWLPVAAVTRVGSMWNVSVPFGTSILYGFTAGARFLMVNSFSDLDQAGEYVIDRAANLLYFLPPTNVDLTSANASTDTALSMSTSGVVLQTTGTVSFVNFIGLEVSFSRLAAMKFSGASQVSIVDCNVSPHSSTSIQITGVNNLVQRVRAMYAGCKSVIISGGSQPTLSAANNTVDSCLIRNISRLTRTYNPGISFGGVGQRITNNCIQHGPHQGLGGGGNNHLFRGNYLADLTTEVSDSGAFYIGRTWAQRGHLVTNNTFSRIRNTVGFSLGYATTMAVYLDDQQCKYLIFSQHNTTFSSHTHTHTHTPPFSILLFPFSFDRPISHLFNSCSWLYGIYIPHRIII